MNNQQSNESEFFIYLTIEGTNIEKAEVLITDLNKSIKEQIEAIKKEFKLQEQEKEKNINIPITYCLGRAINGTSEYEIFESVDNNDREQCFLDYNIKPGDHLVLIRKNIIPG